ncbi:TonB-dependent receptor [Marinomonas transparens]|uniref:TonB-dependent siderophore receptor n=1 Tax=Marinomonas transparens TaxID=2795388 RepID=A0A934JYM2_9GAMM|nr:TonB-dependent siderophore receptor [Marinomonas transparens]MBJ7539337.1 TonB-dependent siderophore receptor [Marinomonas transparens]
MYPLQYPNDKSNSEQENIQKSLPFARNTLMSAKNTLSLGMTIGAVFVYSSSTYAQEASDEKTAALPEITVEGAREENPIYSATDGQILETNHAGFLGNKDALDTPFSAISYTDKFIEDQQATDITDIISATDASIHSNNISGESRESYSIRGFTSDSNDVTVNGLTGMAPHFRSATEMYERVEVLKGPSAMLNGMAPNGSLGGSINLTTKRAGNDPLTRLTTQYVSDSQLGGHLDVGRRYGENEQFGVRINGAYLSGDGTIDSQEKESELGSIALDWRGERVRLSADFYRTEEQVNAPTRGVNIATGIDIPSPPNTNTLLNPSWAYYNSETKGIITRGEFDINEQLTAYASIGMTKWDYAGLSADRATISNSNGDINNPLGYVDDDRKKVSMEMGLNGHFQTGNVNHQIAANLTRYEEEANQYGTRFASTFSTNIYNPVWGAAPDLDLNAPLLTTTETTLSSYGLADTLSFMDDKYQLTLGARYQEVKTEQTGGLLSTGALYDENAITPSAALLVKLTDSVSAYANYIEGLSKGATAPTSADNAGEIFSPYKTKQKEIGLKLDNGDFVHTVSLYEIEKPDSYTDTDTNIFGYYGEQRNRGAEWSFFGSPVENVRLMGGVTHINAEITAASDSNTEGNQAAGVPKWQAKLGAEWDMPHIQNLTVIAKANAVSKQYLQNDNVRSLPGYTIYGLGARYSTTVNTMPLTIRANIDNLMDKATWSAASYNDLGLVEGRTLTLSAAMEF